jgi:hypothetical protein
LIAAAAPLLAALLAQPYAPPPPDAPAPPVDIAPPAAAPAPPADPGYPPVAPVDPGYPPVAPAPPADVAAAPPAGPPANLAAPFAGPPVVTAAPLPRAGLFAAGINIDLIEIGMLEAFGRGGSTTGAFVGLGPEIDLGPHAALRVPLQIGVSVDQETPPTGGEGRSRSFLKVVLSPAYIYRFRHAADQRWIPFAGAGIDLGFFQFGRQLLGLDPSPAGTSQDFVRAGAAPTLLAGALFNPVRWFSFRFGAEYTYFFVAHTSAHALSETIALRFSF